MTKTILFSAGCFASLTLFPLSAATVLDDSFDDSTLTGWSQPPFGGTGSVVESGTTVNITSITGSSGESTIALQSEALVDTTTSTPTQMTLDIASTSSTTMDGQILFGYLDEGFAGFFVVQARIETGNINIRVEAGAPGGGGTPADERLYQGGSFSYTIGDPLNFIFTFDETSFRVQETEASTFDTGFLPFASSFSDGNDVVVNGYNPLTGLTSEANVALVSQARSSNSTFNTEINQVTVEGVAASIPEPSTAILTTLGAIGLLRRRRR